MQFFTIGMAQEYLSFILLYISFFHLLSAISIFSSLCLTPNLHLPHYLYIFLAIFIFHTISIITNKRTSNRGNAPNNLARVPGYKKLLSCWPILSGKGNMYLHEKGIFKYFKKLRSPQTFATSLTPLDS